MTRPAAPGPPTGDEPLDDTDLAILDDLRQLFQAADPMPADLPERIRFALELPDLEYEVALLAAEEDQRLAASRGAEQSRTITFDSDSLTIMIRIDANSDGTSRVDGWLAPPERRRIELRIPGGALLAAADEHGRFVFGHVPHGTAQLIVRAGEEGGPETGEAGRTVITPALMI